MSYASQPKPLQERFASRRSRLQISEIVEQAPPSKYESVGLELQAHRTRKGHELEMAGQVLRINLRHLQAIEDSCYDALPGRTYAVGFVRAYAEFLGLDPEDCVRRFKLEYDVAINPVGEETAGSPKKMGMVFPDLQEDTRLPTGSILVVTGLLILGVWGGWYLSTTDERAFSDLAAETGTPEADGLPSPEQAQALLATTIPAAEEDAPVADVASEEASGAIVNISEDGPETLEAAPLGTGANSGPETLSDEIASPEPETLAVSVGTAPVVATSGRESQVFGVQNHSARVILRARGNTWVRIEGEDGSVLFEQTLQRGDSYRVPNRNGLIMATRNAGAVEMIVDGASLGPAGSVGQAQLNKTLDANVLLTMASQQP